MPGRRSGGLVVAGAWFLAGVGSVLSQRPPEPTTVPLLGNGNAIEEAADVAPGPIPGAWRGRVMVNRSDASVNVQVRPLTISVSPILRFLDHSPDGCWTVLVPPGLREGGEPRLVSSRVLDAGAAVWAYRIRGQGPARLRVEPRSQTGATEIEAVAALDRPVFSHLNSFCDLEVRGHRRLFLEFSPSPGARVEVRRFDYPVGRPARFAYVDASRAFRVVEASSGEKGPFRTLAEGRLPREEPLTITLHDEDRAVARVTLHDWSTQAGIELSPTAGWGVPVNAIEFSLSGESPSSPANLFVTLAGTSVGRGWDCVTHPAGSYRNRMAIEPCSPP